MAKASVPPLPPEALDRRMKSGCPAPPVKPGLSVSKGKLTTTPPRLVSHALEGTARRIEKILTHLGLWPFPSHTPPHSAGA
jgi:hypothetical protein